MNIETEYKTPAKRGPKKNEDEENDLVSMTLLKNYRPLNTNFLIEEVDKDKNVTLREPGGLEGIVTLSDGTTDLEGMKVKAGTVIHISRAEARNIRNAKIADRNDDL